MARPSHREALFCSRECHTSKVLPGGESGAITEHVRLLYRYLWTRVLWFPHSNLTTNMSNTRDQYYALIVLIYLSSLDGLLEVELCPTKESEFFNDVNVIIFAVQINAKPDVPDFNKDCLIFAIHRVFCRI